ncbi:MAG TPA: hypothetical protein VG308_04645, partial [Stellaceae bacterium]|nr:hypothetical protein [Stellaceae bacterium]
MRRRDLVAALGGAGFVGLGRGAGAADTKPFRVGVASLVNGPESQQFMAFAARLRELLGAAGRELELDFRVLDGDASRYPAAMRELASRNPDVLVAPGPEVSLKAARAATSTIPIVMVGVDYDPLALGHVQSLARPGG